MADQGRDYNPPEYREWPERRAAIRAKLTRDLEATKLRAKTLEAALAKLDELDAALSVVVSGRGGRTTREPKQASISSLIMDAIREKSGGTAADIVRFVRNERPAVNGKVVHAILYRLRVDHKVKASGERGEMTYEVAQVAPVREGKARRRNQKAFKAAAKQYFLKHPGQHSVADVARAIGCKNPDQVRNILVRLKNEGMIRRLADGIYETPLESESEVTADEGS